MFKLILHEIHEDLGFEVGSSDLRAQNMYNLQQTNHDVELQNSWKS